MVALTWQWAGFSHAMSLDISSAVAKHHIHFILDLDGLH
jgi:hypothetical protein